MLKESIRPIYFELFSYLDGVKDLGAKTSMEYYKLLGEQYNGALDVLLSLIEDEAIKEDIQRFKIQVSSDVMVPAYRNKLSGIVGYLYGRYFHEELQPPFGNEAPNMVIQQHQSQKQSTFIELQSSISDLMEDAKDEEKGILKKMTEIADSSSSLIDFLSKIIPFVQFC